MNAKTPNTRIARVPRRASLRGLALWVALLATGGLASAGLAGCERDDRYTAALVYSDPVAVQGHAAWLFTEDRSLRLLDPDSLHQFAIDLGVAPTALFAAPDGSGLAVLDAEGVTWVPMQADGPGSPVRYVVGTGFSAVTFNPERTRMVLHHARGLAPTGGLTNLNQIAIVDLNAAPSAQNPVTRSLRAFGQQPTAIVVAPEAPVGAADRQLTWVLSNRYLVLLDLMAPEAEEVSVQLTLEGDARTVLPVQVVPARSADGPVAFVRAVGTSDLYVLSFDDAAPIDAVPRPVLNELPAGMAADGMAVLEVDAGLRAFLVGGGRSQLTIVDPATSELQTVDLEAPAARLELFRAPRPEDDPDGGEGNYALAWSTASEVVSFIDLDRVAQLRGRAIRSLRIGSPLRSLAPLPGRHSAVCRTADDYALVLLDFDDRTATPLTAGVAIGQVVPDPAGGPVYVTLPRWYGTDGEHAAEVVAMNPDTGGQVRVTLPEDGTLLVVPGTERIVSLHDAPGKLSVFDRDPAVGAQVTTRDLIFLEGILNP